MSADHSFIEQNRASTARIRTLAALPDDALRVPVGEHWTVAITLAHLAFWDRRVLAVLWATVAGIAIGVSCRAALAHLAWKLRGKSQKRKLMEDFLGLGLIAVVFFAVGVWRFQYE